MKHIDFTLHRISTFVIILTAFLLPLTYLPLTLDAYEFPKFALIVSATAVLCLLWAARSIVRKEIAIVITPFTLPLFLFTLAQVASLVIVSPNKIQPLITPGSVGTTISLFIFYILASLLSKDYDQSDLGSKVRFGLTLSAVILSIQTLIVLSLQFVPKSIAIPSGVKPFLFYPQSSPLVLATILAVLLSICIGPFVKRLIENRWSSKKHASTHRGETTLEEIWEQENDKPFAHVVNWFYLGATVLILIAEIGTIYQITTTAKPLLLPYWAGWAVAVEGLKQIKSALFGVGEANFLAAFTQGKPIAINTTPLWGLYFTVSSNYYLQLLTESGLIALSACVFYLYKLWQATKTAFLKTHAEQAAFYLGIWMIMLLHLFFPTNITLLFLVFLFSAIVGVKLHESYIFSQQSIILPIGIAFGSSIGILGLVYGGGRVYGAEIQYKYAFDAVQNNSVINAYNNTIKAISLNPFVNQYHSSNAQINLAIANGLTKVDKIDAQTRSTITQLVQQAIQEAKLAITYQPTSVRNWENLAIIYRSLMGVAERADNWTIQVYNQAIRMDPVNPLHHVNLGGVYYSLGKYDEAISQFQMAVSLKADFANAYYNLAFAYNAKNDLKNAAASMKQVLLYLPQNSADYNKAKSELAQLESAVLKDNIAGASTTSPTPTPTSAVSQLLHAPPASSEAQIKPPLQLGSGAAPTISIVAPSPTPNP